MQALRRSWVRLSVRATARRVRRAQRRLSLVQMEQDSLLLRLKELEQRRLSLLHRQEEMEASRSFRTPTPPTSPTTVETESPTPTLDETLLLQRDLLRRVAERSTSQP